MSLFKIQQQTLIDIANAVREKRGTTDLIKVSELPAEIANIQAGGGDNQWEGYWLNTATHLEFPEGLTSLPQDVCRYRPLLESVVIPDSVTKIGTNAFSDTKNLSITKLPNNLITLEAFAFLRCGKLAVKEIPSTVETLRMYSLSQSDYMTTVTFKGTPTTIASDTFDGCKNLTVINVPWAEGAVANAPWGATNVETINYNYTGE